jgi:predicted NUDIX family NTP pyrophosphohydrolase
VHRLGVDGVEVLLAHPGGPYYVRKDDGVWTIPKGELDPGEEPLAAAVREFTEEMGSPPPPGELRPLGQARQNSRKTNVVWAVEGEFDPAGVRSNTFPMEWPPRSGRTVQVEEIDRAEWFPLALARVKIRSGQLPFLDRLEALLADTADDADDDDGAGAPTTGRALDSS